jgi:hypothetical protein
MYKVQLFQHKSQFNIVFNVNPGNQGSPINFCTKRNSLRCACQPQNITILAHSITFV